ncbi:MAG: AarF/ABC1/UbiB kinase family protein [Deltaproteobacteria bacterium]|nr:AarF/ABC1/UbiB kinase family protein [Deltaproteobacteria bacterium]
MTDPDKPKKTDEQKAEQPTSSRFARFARMSSLTAGVAARHFGQKVASAFRDDDEQEKAKKESQLKSATQITKTLGELKGAAMKLGQMLATDPELLPKEMVEELQKLGHSAPPMPFSTVKQVVEEALGQPLDEVFTEFSEQPIGAASIGQVHRAKMRDGTDVAVKVQYPGIADTIVSDMRNLGGLLALARAQLPRERVDAYLEEVTSVIQAESDYLKEAENLERFQFVLKNLKGVRVPTPVHELTRKNVLVMEYLSGQKIETWLETAPAAQKHEQGKRLLEVFLQTIHRHHVLHADPHPGNFMILDSAEFVDGAPVLGILDCGCVREYEAAFCDDLIALLVTLWKHDVEAMQVAWLKLGFIDKGVNPDDVYEWCQLILAPMLQDVDWDFGGWKIQEQAISFVLAHPKVKLWAPPREVIFYIRTLAGLRGLLAKTGLKLNTYRMSRAMAEERGQVKKR